MIYNVGCELSISCLAQIMDRMQDSEQYKNYVFSMNTGRKGGIVIQNKFDNFKVNVRKSIYDSWPFIPDNKISHLYQENDVFLRWGLNLHTITSFRIDDFENLIQIEIDNIELVLRHIKLFAYFSNWCKRVLNDNLQKKNEIYIFSPKINNIS